ncbi:MAG: threonine synthase, partial [Phycisphaerae bacterium]|nr:threonine synthase [Phycisphaerae bacterium]
RMKAFAKRWAQRNERLNFSGVWRFRELLKFATEQDMVSLGEGQTILQNARALADYVDIEPPNIFLQYEGLNPSGSFKDNGMAGAFTHARMVGAKTVACASTGNTSAAVAMFASAAGMQAVAFIGSGKIAYGKLAQALDYGAKTIQIEGDFDVCMQRVQQVAERLGLYMMNSINPFRLEGQKAIMYRVLEGLNWQVPDWIVVPGGNLGNSSAFGKAFMELEQLKLIERAPRMAIINAAGADTLYRLVEQEKMKWNDGRCDPELEKRFFEQMDSERRWAKTLASAIEINRPVNLRKCLRALHVCNGLVRTVSDEEILDAKAIVGRIGLGCEPASAASVAGLRKLRGEGIIGKNERVVCILTGHALKDPNVTVDYHTEVNLGEIEKYQRVGVKRANLANRPVVVADDLDKIIEAVQS